MRGIARLLLGSVRYPPPHVRGPGEAWLAARGVDWVPAQRESVVAVLDAAFEGDRAVLDEYGVVFPVGAELTRQWVEAILVQLDVEIVGRPRVGADRVETRSGVDITVAALAMADEFDIELGEAAARLERQTLYEQVSKWLHESGSTRFDGFGGVWIDHDAGGVLTFGATAGAVPPSAYEALQASGVIQRRPVRYSLDELRRVGRSIEEQLRGSSLGRSISVDVSSNAVEVVLPEASPVEFDLAPGLRGAVQVSFAEPTPRPFACPLTGCDQVNGGVMVSPGCTLGYTFTRSSFFPVPSVWTNQVTTAGHCVSTGEVAYQAFGSGDPSRRIGTVVWRREGGSTLLTTDVALIDASGRQLPSKPGTIWRPSNPEFPIWAQADSHAIPEGTYVCRVGIQTEIIGPEKCGIFVREDLNTSIPSVGIDLVNSPVFNLFACFGDSGSPIFTPGSHMAVATTVGGQTDENFYNGSCTPATADLYGAWVEDTVAAFAEDRPNESISLDTLSPSLLRVTTNPPLPSQISIERNGVAWPANTWGLDWVKVTPGQYTIRFSDVVGWQTPAPIEVTVVSGQTTAVAGNFTKLAQLRVETSPYGTDGLITVDGIPYDNFGTWTHISGGQHQICFGPAPGYDPPPCQTVMVPAGFNPDGSEIQTHVIGTYTPNPSGQGPANVGRLRVVTSPAVNSSIRIDGITRDNWGLDWVQLAPGTYELSFSDVEGFTTPLTQTVTIVPGQIFTAYGIFAERGEIRVQTNDLDNLDPGIQGVPGTIYLSDSTGAQHYEFPRNDWGLWTWLEPGPYRICWGPVAGYLSPSCRDITLGEGALADPNGEVGGYLRG